MNFFSALAIQPPQAHLVCRGDLDAFAAHLLRQRLEDAIDSGCIRFTVDASEVTFIDAGGVGLLVRLRTAVLPFGGGITVTAASNRFRQVVELVGLEGAFDLDLLHDEPVSGGCRAS